MILLLAFALIAGAGTAVTPCVLPILPVLLSAGATGGRRRPLGIALGLVATFTLAIVALASLLRALGLPGDLLRWLAIGFLVAFGVLLLAPGLAARIEAPLSRLARFGPRTHGQGFWSGLGVGAALGLVAAPCTGPILGAVISVGASRGTSAQLVAVGLAFALGFGLVLALLALGGRAIVARIRAAGRGAHLQGALGGVILLTALVMGFGLDRSFENALADHVPAVLVDPTHSLERSGAVARGLGAVRGRSRFAAPGAASPTAPSGDAARRQGGGAPPLPVLGRAPAFTETQRWFNTGGRALSLAGLHGRVVLVDFWTYTCINCIRTLPALRALDAKYRRDGLTVVGVHTPEFPFEHDAGNVAAAIRQNRLRYPVVQDNDYGTWDAYQNQYWPAEYLIDGAGNVRYVHFGEGHDAQTEAAIRALLVQAGARRLGGRAHPRADVPTGLATPETYLGTRRARGWVAPWAPRAGTHRYPPLDRELPLSGFALSGAWRVTPEGATAVRDATVHLRFQAKKVYLVLTPPPSEVAQVGVRLDGKPLSAGESGADVFGGSLTATRQRLYELVALPVARRGKLTVTLPPGVSAYAFTFG